MVSQREAENGFVLIGRVLPVPHRVERTAWPVFLSAPAVLDDDVMRPQASQCRVDLGRRLATVDGVHQLRAVPMATDSVCVCVRVG